jgi:hypothetical protein
MFQNQQITKANANVIDVPWSGVGDITPTAVPFQEMCYLASSTVSGVVVNAAHGVTELADTSNKLTNQIALATAFLGFACERKVATDLSGTIAIDRTSIKQMSCNVLGTASNVGDMLAGSCVSGTALQSNMVEVTTNVAAAIGYSLGAPAGATVIPMVPVCRVVCGTIPNANQAINTAANLSLTGNATVGGTAAVNGAMTVTGALAGSSATFSTTARTTGLLSEKAGTLAAAGTAIGNAAAITAQATIVSGANNAAGVQLPAIAAGYFSPLYVKNPDATNSVKVYPAVNCAIDTGSSNAAATLAAAETRVFISDGNATYYSLKGA